MDVLNLVGEEFRIGQGYYGPAGLLGGDLLVAFWGGPLLLRPGAGSTALEAVAAMNNFVSWRVELVLPLWLPDLFFYRTVPSSAESLGGRLSHAERPCKGALGNHGTPGRVACQAPSRRT